MDIISKLTEYFRQFPGIGPRQSKRFVYHLLVQNNAYREQLAKLIVELGKTIEVCQSCYRFFPLGSKRMTVCAICSDESRSKETLLVVSRDVDFENIEKSHSYTGKYFILGGSVPILEKDPESRVRSKELVRTVEERARPANANDPANLMGDDTAPRLKEIIVALNLTPEGENTQYYIEQVLAPLAEKYGIKISTLGRGLSTGLELEYSDSETIKNALKNRS